VVKCFCGEEAKYHVTVENHKDLQYMDVPRCEQCKDSAVNSYDDVTVTELD